MKRTCGTCRWGKPTDNRGGMVCQHPDGRRFTVATTVCRCPRRWWEPKEQQEQQRLAL